jgi:hypothetical protein
MRAGLERDVDRGAARRFAGLASASASACGRPPSGCGRARRRGRP